MTNFWRFAKHLLHEKSSLFWAMVFACFSAGGLAAGLVSMGPLLKIILTPGSTKSLVDVARDFNAEGGWGGYQIPEPFIATLPADQFRGVLLILGVIGVLTIVGGIANFIHQYLSQTITTRAIARIREEAFDNVIHMPLARVMSRGPSEFIARILRDAAEKPSASTTSMKARGGRRCFTRIEGSVGFRPEAAFSFIVTPDLIRGP